MRESAPTTAELASLFHDVAVDAENADNVARARANSRALTSAQIRIGPLLSCGFVVLGKCSRNNNNDDDANGQFSISARLSCSRRRFCCCCCCCCC